MDKKQLTKILVIAFSIALFALLLSQISINDLLQSFSSISIEYLIICFAIYTASNVVRALRFSIMLNKAGSIYSLFNIVCLHNLANNIMPFKTGELAFVYLARSRYNLSLGIGVVTVAITRLYDALAVCILFVLAVFMVGQSSTLLSEATPVIVGMGIMLFLAIFSIIWFGPFFITALQRVPEVRVLNRDPVGFIRSKVLEVSSYYSSPESKKAVIPVLFLSAVIWAMNSVSMYFLINNLGVYMGIWLIMIGTLISVIFSGLPIHGIGRFGTSELVWSGIFIALGAPKEIAISTGIATHLITLGFSLILGFGVIALDRYPALMDKIRGRKEMMPLERVHK